MYIFGLHTTYIIRSIYIIEEQSGFYINVNSIKLIRGVQLIGFSKVYLIDYEQKLFNRIFNFIVIIIIVPIINIICIILYAIIMLQEILLYYRHHHPFPPFHPFLYYYIHVPNILYTFIVIIVAYWGFRQEYVGTVFPF